MATWRNALPLSNTQRSQIREGILIEYAPGMVASADLAATSGLRGALLVPLLPGSYTAVTLTALWIHTGWRPPGRMLQLHAAHPARSKPPATHRRTIPPEFTIIAGGVRLTSPERTCIDLLLMESADVAVEAILRLLSTHTDITGLKRQIDLEHGRRRLAFACSMVDAIASYLDWRKEALCLSASHAACPPSSIP